MDKMTSICMITYNHAEFISQAVEGILKQETDFLIEFVIGEDCSTDQTREICLKYEQEYPEIVRVLPRTVNLGAASNFIDALSNCKGKYIALCEGDDYWTDPLKLQKQINFLEANPDFAICFHRVNVKYEDDDEKSYLSNPDQKEITTFEDLAAGNYIHTPSCVFRNSLFGEFPEWYKDSPVGDYPLHLLNAEHGKIKFFEDVMAVYRVHKGGVWSLQSMEKGSAEYMKTVEFCKNHFAPRGTEQFSKMIDACLTNLCFLAFENQEYQNYRAYYRRCIKGIRKNNFRMALSLTVRYLLSYSPATALIYRKISSDVFAR